MKTREVLSARHNEDPDGSRYSADRYRPRFGREYGNPSRGLWTEPHEFLNRLPFRIVVDLEGVDRRNGPRCELTLEDDVHVTQVIDGILRPITITKVFPEFTQPGLDRTMNGPRFPSDAV